jgi:uncharacterized membrane protein YgcG
VTRRLALLVLLASILPSLGALGTLYIKEFTTSIDLDMGGRLSIEELITVTFQTAHHGIEREIPVSYRVPSTGANLALGFDLDRVLLDGSSVPVESHRSGRDIVLRIGDPDRTITGTHVYAIRYAIERAILFHDDYLQIYWNATGNDWSIPIAHATAVLRLPASVDPTSASTTSYVGYSTQSRSGGSAVIDAEGRLVFDAGPFNPGEGLTIDVAVPRELLPIAPPSFGENVLVFLNANKAAVLPLLAFAGMLFLWFRIGRDPRKRVIAPAFAPPRGMHAGEVGVLIDDRIDLRDVSAMVVGLAVKGHLRIEEVADDDPDTRDKARGRSTPLDYRFVRCDAPLDDLSEPERLVLDGIFSGEATERTLSSLENSFYKELPTIKSRLYGKLIEAGYYPNNPERTRGFFRNLGLLIIAGGVFAGVHFASLYLGAAVALSGLVVLAFAPIMPRKTQKGVRALEEILGLARYIQLAEVDRIEFHNAPEKGPEVFERLLPYAIALNLTRVWTDQFSGLLSEPPEWYRSSSAVFRPNLFTLSLWQLSLGMDRTLASAPRSAPSGRSAWGGGGGASFGGGFSGGGFGGGGGGGW